MGASARDTRFWDKIARKYAASPIADAAGYERTLEATRRHVRSSDVVLEFGCGTGTTALKLAPHVARYVATDISGEMIAIGREKAQSEALSNLALEQAALEHPPWPDSTFDAALGFNVLHLIKDRKTVLANLRRLLKPGGLLITKTPCLSEMNPFVHVLVFAMRLVGKAPTVAFFSGAELSHEIEAAGFSIIERAQHASKGRDPRPFLVARKS